MPRLPEPYTAPLGGLPQVGGRRAGPDDMGGQIGDAVADAGRLGSHLIQQHRDQIEEDDARDALVETQKVKAKYSQRIREASLTGEDTEKIAQQFEDELSAITSNRRRTAS
jgi:hypothetical protein